MTWPEVAAARRAAAVVIVPLGSREQHDRGMGLQTDTVRAVELAKLVAERLAQQVVITPSVSFGLSSTNGLPGHDHADAENAAAHRL
jgi:creatinine amidohydrolase/Fe(II)-dependent formamide hydrolase-like protein